MVLKPVWALLLGLFVGWTLPATAQPRKSYVAKVDLLGPVFGEYRFAFERKLTNHQFLYTSAGYFARENRVDPRAQEVENPNSIGNLFRTFFRSDYNKWLYSSAGYYFRDFDAERERLHGPVVRLGLRQYFLTRYAPKGPYFYLGAHYSFLWASAFDAQYELLEKLNLHKPGLSASAGHQWLLGVKRLYAVEVFGGLEYYYLIHQRGLGRGYEFRNIPNLILYAGLQVGLAFKAKNRP